MLAQTPQAPAPPRPLLSAKQIGWTCSWGLELLAKGILLVFAWRITLVGHALLGKIRLLTCLLVWLECLLACLWLLGLRVKLEWLLGLLGSILIWLEWWLRLPLVWLKWWLELSTGLLESPTNACPWTPRRRASHRRHGGRC